MKMLLLVVLAAAVAAQTTPEDPGGWKAAKWGMTQDEVLAALAGQNPRVAGQPQNGTARVEIERVAIAGHDFSASFVPGKSGGLVRVGLTTPDRNPPAAVFDDLRKALIEQHGQPASSDMKRDGLVLEQVVKWEFPTTAVRLSHTFSPAIRVFVISLMYEKKGAEENKDLHTAIDDGSTWRVSKKTDALTGQTRTEFSLRGKYIESPRRSGATPTMLVRCAVGNRAAGKTSVGGQFLEAYVDFGVLADSQPAGILVHYRIDDGQIINQFWSRSTDFRAGFFGPKELGNILYGKPKGVRDGEPVTPVRKVVVATQEYVASQIVAQFDMPDPKEVGESCGLLIHEAKK